MRIICKEESYGLCVKGKDSQENLKNYGSYIASLLTRLDYGAIGNVIKCFLEARKRNATIFFAGNGGSAATASHFSQDLGGVGRKIGVKCFRTISLTDSTPFMTALGNDYGYDKIFTYQLRNLFQKGDIFVAISASGNSPNIVEAVKWAKRSGGIVIGFIGFDGGKLLKLCHHAVHVPTDKNEYGPVEDIHIILNHMITSSIMHSNYFTK